MKILLENIVTDILENETHPFDTLTFTDEQLNLLKKYGTKQSTSGRELYIPPALKDELDKRANDSDFKKEYVSITKYENVANAYLAALKKALTSGNTAKIGGKTYFVLPGGLSRNNRFYFRNPYFPKGKSLPSPKSKTTNQSSIPDWINLTPEDIEQIASKYNSKDEFKKGDYVAYYLAGNYKMLNKLFPV
jgi:hypothetical protein